jgi:DNA-directed RNA polymerase subunit alpha
MTSSPAVTESLIKRPALSLAEVLNLIHQARLFQNERQPAERALEHFDKEVAPHVSGEELKLRRAALLWAVGKREEASEALIQLPGNGIARFLLGRMAWEGNDLLGAAELFKDAAKHLPNDPHAKAAWAHALLESGKVAEAKAVVKGLPENNADACFARGRFIELDSGDLEAALAEYEKAIELDPDHAWAVFRSAFIYDMRGNDAKAIELYKRIAESEACYVGAVTNLGLLYEDAGDLEKAVACYRNVVRVQPGNRRVRLYLRDAIESADMYYDETEKQESERLESILKTPVGDFELSVRSRNCLAKMNIKSLGDLVQKSEPEMLAYKNFGETSLREIKKLLAAKGLYLGMIGEGGPASMHKERLRLAAMGSENPAATKPIADLDLSVRSRKCMARLGISTLGELMDKTEAELLSVKNFGQTSLTEIKEKLGELALGLKRVD